jgi:hypothetical protein
MMLSAARSISAAALRVSYSSSRTTRLAAPTLRSAPGYLSSAMRRPVRWGSSSPVLCAAAGAEAKEAGGSSGAAAGAPAGGAAAYPPLRVTAPGRVVALGDIHGDIGQARRALAIAGVLGDGGDAVNPEWVGLALFCFFTTVFRRQTPIDNTPRPVPATMQPI